MKHIRLLLVAFALAVVATATAATAQASSSQRSGAVYTLTNSPGGNAVAVFDRDSHGSLTPAGTFATGGAGTGAGLGSQGALAISADAKLLFAVNAASNTISELAIEPHALRLVATAPSGGSTPISVTVHDGLLYVLNAGGAGDISGFAFNRDGITPIAGSTRPLGAGSAGPAQVAFTPGGTSLVVTEKVSSTIDTYTVGADGVASAPTVSASAGQTPFGFDFDPAGHLLVSEAATQSASSYAVAADGVHVISGVVPTNGQAAPCWLIVTRDGRYAYTANAGSGTLSGYSIGADGSLALLDASGVSANLGAGSHPLDEAVSRDGSFLYNLTDGQHAISGFVIAADGSLTRVAFSGGLPAGTVGLVAS
jgi:6-phosphogluconolactonase